MAKKKAPPNKGKGLGLPWDDKSDVIVKQLKALTKAVLLLTKAFVERGIIVAATTQNILDLVTQQRTIVNGLGTFVQGLKDKATAVGVTQDQLDQIFSGLTDNDAILTALTANTDVTTTPGGP